ncbi:polygalacturonase-like [Momordica charantia]|uniref:Polygalacturonase-like n=1 Tax=Momordica charantia TaxID=3673 RepID=A0A6J1D4L9_MOMCH|nr:polygalacturonase-like [Momordica charantia]
MALLGCSQLVRLSLLLLLLDLALGHPGLTFNIVSLGAKADGRTDASFALQTAWGHACGSPVPATIYVPNGTFYVQSGTFSGPCKNNAITVRIDGTLVASSDIEVLANTPSWMAFRHLNGLSIYGGVLDGQGKGLWACKKSRSGCPVGATTLEVSDTQNVMISGLSSLNSQMFHIVVRGCENVKIQGAKVLAPGDSPNTDGIHVQQSSNVAILSSTIGTGDDCISIGPGTSHLWMEKIACGPGHGISIGSLGKGAVEAGVENVTVKTASFTGTMNGVRIKSWGRPSSGFARNVHFEHIVFDNVENPVIVDQNYCPGGHGCPGQASGVKISDVTYQDIHGTSATEVALKFDCSPSNPCTGFILEDIRVTYKDKIAEAICNNAIGTASGLVQPSMYGQPRDALSH